MSLIKTAPVRGQDMAVRVSRPGERRSMSRSATRALDVLELFGAMRRPLKAVEIARALQMHSSTANQLLKTMVDSAHLVFDARNKTYLPSPRLAAFASWIDETFGASGRLSELVGDVNKRTGMVVTVSTPNDLYMQLLDLATPHGREAERGLKVSVFGSAVGSAYLTTLDETELRRLAIRARIPSSQVHAIIDEVAGIRVRGYAYGALEGSSYWSIAMPLAMQGSDIPVVLGLAGHVDEVQSRLQELSSIMRDAIAHWIAPSADSE